MIKTSQETICGHCFYIRQCGHYRGYGWLCLSCATKLMFIPQRENKNK